MLLTYTAEVYTLISFPNIASQLTEPISRQEEIIDFSKSDL